LQSILPEAVLVGGTAAALHAGHRISLDGDHVVQDLKDRFEEVMGRLDSTPGWRTERVQRPVLILGSLDGFLTGVRQQRRSRSLEVEVVEGLHVPTLREMARIKAWLLVTRDATRDLLDVVALLDKLGEAGVRDGFSNFDAIYERGPEGGQPLVEVIDNLGAARPADKLSLDLKSYKGARAPWNDWSHLEARSRFWAGRLSVLLLGSGGAGGPLMEPLEVLARSRALWNRQRLDLSSDEVLAQILDRGSVEDWRALYRLMAEGGTEAHQLRGRVLRILLTVPTGRPHFWRAALSSLGHAIDWTGEPRRDPGEVDI
jgi:hypothetical protein